MYAMDTLEERDYQYSPSRWTKKRPPDTVVADHMKVELEATKVAQQTLKCDLGVKYAGPDEQTLDIYHAQVTADAARGQPSDAVFVYFHGGNWLDLGTEHSGFMAVPFTKNGVTVVAVGYDLAPKVNMTTIVEQCRKACVYIRGRFPSSKIFLGGHSAGAQLAACMFYTDWMQYGLETSPLSGAAMFSGLYDLAPLKHCYINDDLHFTDEEVDTLSPLRQLNCLSVLTGSGAFSCLIVHGGQESDEFKRHSREYYEALQSHRVECSMKVLEDEDHFSFVERLMEEDYVLTKLILSMIHRSDTQE